jgi:hypothetical protein
MIDPKVIAEHAVKVAIRNLGYGETTANNAGRFIDAIGGAATGIKQPSWCALFAGYDYRESYRELDPLGVTPQWLFRRAGVPEPGAARLVLAMARVGRRFKDPELARPGDLLLWKRDGGHHVGILEFVDEHLLCHTIEGNVGRFPAPVKRLVHDVEREPHFVTFASLTRAG